MTPGVRLLGTAIAAAVLLLSASPAGAVSRPFFGVVNSDHLEAVDFRMMGEARVGTVRFQLAWSQVQPTQGGPYDWSSVDAQVEGAALNGIEPFPVLYGTPDYASRSDKEPPLGSNEDKRAWKEFVAAVVERYGAGGKFWQTFELRHPGVERQPVEALQIWNEQNSPSFYEPRPSPRRYAELLRISDKAVRSADPGVDVVLGGMFATPSPKKAISSWRFLKRLYKIQGVERHFDAVALHPYSPNLAGIRVQLERARKRVKKAGDARTPTWITEIGWGSAQLSGFGLSTSPKGQKKMLRKSFDLLLDRRRRWKVRRVMWFSWADPVLDADVVGVICGWCGSAGLLRTNRNPKPSFNKFRSFTEAGGGR